MAGGEEGEAGRLKCTDGVAGRHLQEEQGRLCPKLRKAGLDLGALGVRIEERKGELMARWRGRPDAGSAHALGQAQVGEPRHVHMGVASRGATPSALASA